VVRPPRGRLLTVQPMHAGVNMSRVEGDQEIENKTTTPIGFSNLTLLDPVRRAVEALESSPSRCADVGGLASPLQAAQANANSASGS
jgi:hypothetical protein